MKSLFLIVGLVLFSLVSLADNNKDYQVLHEVVCDVDAEFAPMDVEATLVEQVGAFDYSFIIGYRIQYFNSSQLIDSGNAVLLPDKRQVETITNLEALTNDTRHYQIYNVGTNKFSNLLEIQP